MKYGEGKAADLKEKFWKAMGSSSFLFLELDGQSDTSVPMTAQLDKDADSAIWFFSQKNSTFAQLGKVKASFASKGHDLFARFDGTLAVETDQAQFDKLWNNFVAAWYDGGKDDPDLLFLRMDLGNAEIWDGDMSLLNVAKMALGMNVHDDAEKNHVKATPL